MVFPLAPSIQIFLLLFWGPQRYHRWMDDFSKAFGTKMLAQLGAVKVDMFSTLRKKKHPQKTFDWEPWKNGLFFFESSWPSGFQLLNFGNAIFILQLVLQKWSKSEIQLSDFSPWNRWISVFTPGCIAAHLKAQAGLVVSCAKVGVNTGSTCTLICYCPTAYNLNKVDFSRLRENLISLLNCWGYARWLWFTLTAKHLGMMVHFLSESLLCQNRNLLHFTKNDQSNPRTWYRNANRRHLGCISKTPASTEKRKHAKTQDPQPCHGCKRHQK